MAKLTVSDLATLVNTEIAITKIGIASASYVPTVDAITGLIDKIGKQFMLEYNFEDKLPELDSEILEFGQTVEEYFMDLSLPVVLDGDGATAGAPARPSFEDVCYSIPMLQKDIKTTIDDYKMQKAMLGQSEYSVLIAQILKKLYDSLVVYRYFIKKQAIGRLIQILPAVADTQKVIMAKPVDTATAEAFAKSVKNKVEYFQNIHDDGNLASVVATSKPGDLVLYVLEGIKSVLDVDLEAGTFQVGKVTIPVIVRTLEDFGTMAANASAYALLVDTRGIKVFTAKNTTSSQYNGQGEFTNYWLHYIPTVHISKVVNACVWDID